MHTFWGDRKVVGQSIVYTPHSGHHSGLLRKPIVLCACNIIQSWTATNLISQTFQSTLPLFPSGIMDHDSTVLLYHCITVLQITVLPGGATSLNVS